MGYEIVGDGTYSMRLIRHKGKGSLPKKLSGRYTTDAAAKVQIEAYVAQKESSKNVKANGL